MTADEILTPEIEIETLSREIIATVKDGWWVAEVEGLIERFIEESWCNLKIVPMD